MSPARLALTQRLPEGEERADPHPASPRGRGERAAFAWSAPHADCVYSLLSTVCCLLFAVCCLLSTVRYLLPTVCYLLFAPHAVGSERHRGRSLQAHIPSARNAAEGVPYRPTYPLPPTGSRVSSRRCRSDELGPVEAQVARPGRALREQKPEWPVRRCRAARRSA